MKSSNIWLRRKESVLTGSSSDMDRAEGMKIPLTLRMVQVRKVRIPYRLLIPTSERNKKCEFYLTRPARPNVWQGGSFYLILNSVYLGSISNTYIFAQNAY